MLGLGIVLAIATVFQLWIRARDPPGATTFDSANLRDRWRGALQFAGLLIAVGLLLKLIAVFK